MINDAPGGRKRLYSFLKPDTTSAGEYGLALGDFHVGIHHCMFITLTFHAQKIISYRQLVRGLGIILFGFHIVMHASDFGSY